jgi:uncharacterized SAM-binding protein YcdF (DUF218 family)
MNIFRVTIIILIVWFTGFVWFIDQMNQPNNLKKQQFDAIIVLTGARGRIDSGIKLLSENFADKLFISGVGKNVKLDDLSQFIESVPTEDIGNLKDKITLGHFATSTEENAIETLEWLKQNNFNKIILVTSNYHMLRSVFLFEHYMPNIKIMPFFSSKNSISLKYAFIEYNKYLLCVAYKNIIED